MKEFEKESVFRIGEVYSVDGRKIKIKVDKNKNSSYIFYQGQIIKNISVGSYIKIVKGYIKIIGKVEGEYIEEDKSINLAYYKQSEKINRYLLVSLLGYIERNKFFQGIKEMPLVFNECYLLDNKEFNMVHNFLDLGEEENYGSIVIGKLALEDNQDIKVSIDKLFASHIGIFGNTGSGKSYTLAKLYHELLEKFKNNKNFHKTSRFVLIDFNGEYLIDDKERDYTIIEPEYKKTFNLNTRNSKDKFPILKKYFEDIEFWAIYLNATEKTQIPFLKRSFKMEVDFENFKIYFLNFIIMMLEKKFAMSDIQNFLEEIGKILHINDQEDYIMFINFINSFIYHSSSEVYYIQPNNTYFNNDKRLYFNDHREELVKEIKNYNFNSFPEKIEDNFLKIPLKIIFQFYNDKLEKNMNMEFIAPLLKRLRRINYLEKVIEVIDNYSENSLNLMNIISLKNVNSEIKKILPLLIVKQLYEEQKVNKNLDNKKYLNIIIDEAHNILSPISNRESEQWKEYRLETFEEIIKEGRKFGVFLTIASQRPSDISSTIISQLHNYFLHRLINNKDIEAVERTISYLDRLSFEYLSILPTGTCILAGLAIPMPIIISVYEIKTGYEPKSETIKLVKHWID
ncbi:ATP-binding protein [Caminibacter pacificus]|uniref:ATP-binding protein n=1 Tax=Caminibacter pacificus TaxID=1424653 RepID=A0AAJ4REJ8_9BACT|nr:ATP-binding protein [Caminibacter pacificus]QDD68099.1 ATP-binding protein [Caminibacter pacificus]ROR41208.1 hypothetical protein EDC58_0695 [Caminibacter pacificus]